MEFGILGTVGAWVDGEPVRVGGPRERKVLAALLLRAGHGVGVDHLTEVVWGETPPATSKAQIHNSVAALRRELRRQGGRGTQGPEPRIAGAEGGFALRLGGARLDAQAFAEGVTAADRLQAGGRPAQAAESLRRALSLWRGPALDAVGSDALRGQAQRLDEQRMTALERRIELDLALGRHRGLVGELSDLAERHPLRERLVGLHMLTLYRSGRQADALAAFHRCRTLLAAELALAPGPELTGLHERILRAEPDLAEPAPAAGRGRHAASPAADTGMPETPAAHARPAPRQLPAVVSDFVGRGGLVEELARLLSTPSGAVPVAAVAGMGGIGKTSLAIRVAHQVADAFPDGQLFADLRGTREDRRPAAEVLTRFIRALDGERALPATEDELRDLYRSLLAGRRILVVLDDAADAAHISPLTPGYPGCAVIVTSRRRLASLDGVHPVDVTELDPGRSAELFAAIVGSERAAAHPAATATVLAACAGMPLAIRLAGARLATRPDWSVADLAARLPERRAHLDELADGDRSVRTSLEASYVTLGPVPARCLRLLGLWEGGLFGPAAFTALTGVPEDESEAALGSLIGAHLVETPETGRYRMHELVRQYALERALAHEQDADRDAAVRRLLTWYLDAADNARRTVRPVRGTAAPAYDGPGAVPGFTEPDTALDWLDRERGNLTAAAAQAARRGMHDLVWYVPLVLADVCHLRGYWSEWLELCRTGLRSACRIPDPEPEAAVSNLAGVACLSLRRLEEAVAYFGRTAALCRASGDEGLEGFALNNLGDTLRFLGRDEEAADALSRALTIAEKTSSAQLQGAALFNLGRVDADGGRLEAAVRRYTRAREIYRANGRKDAEGEVLTELAAVHRRLGALAQALEFLHEAVRAHQDGGNRPGEAAALRELGEAHLSAGDPAAARTAWTAARELFLAIGSDDAHSLTTRLHQETEQEHEQEQKQQRGL